MLHDSREWHFFSTPGYIVLILDGYDLMSAPIKTYLRYVTNWSNFGYFGLFRSWQVSIFLCTTKTSFKFILWRCRGFNSNYGRCGIQYSLGSYSIDFCETRRRRVFFEGDCPWHRKKLLGLKKSVFQQSFKMKLNTSF